MAPDINVDAQVAIEQLDFAPLSSLSAEPSAATMEDLSRSASPAPELAALEVSISDSVDDLSFDLSDFGVAEPQPPAPAEAVGPPPPAMPEMAELAGAPVEERKDEEDVVADVDEPVKVIGTLRIGIPLYNVYLNEADEWSRRLATELAEWALELNRPMPDSTVGLAHALAGSSATVGFHTLSDIARVLEGTLQKMQSLAYGTSQHGQAFIAAAEEIRRLLHQFAAGFLKEADPRVVAACWRSTRSRCHGARMARTVFSTLSKCWTGEQSAPPVLPPPAVEPEPAGAPASASKRRLAALRRPPLRRR